MLIQKICKWLNCCKELEAENERLIITKNACQELLNNCETQRDALAKHLEDDEERIKQLNDLLNNASDYIKQLEKENKELKASVNKIPPYKGKHTEAKITYSRYMLVGKDEIKQFNIM